MSPCPQTNSRPPVNDCQLLMPPRASLRGPQKISETNDSEPICSLELKSDSQYRARSCPFHYASCHQHACGGSGNSNSQRQCREYGHPSFQTHPNIQFSQTEPLDWWITLGQCIGSRFCNPPAGFNSPSTNTQHATASLGQNGHERVLGMAIICSSPGHSFIFQDFKSDQDKAKPDDFNSGWCTLYNHGCKNIIN